MTSEEQYEQRERIATAAMAAILSRRSVGGTYADIVQAATKYADALIEELNKEAWAMSDNSTINKSDIGEAMMYYWSCPDCEYENEEMDSEPVSDYPLYCEGCGATITVIDD